MTDIRTLLPRPDGRALVVGTSGSGKTVFIERIMRELEKDRRVVVTDPKAEFPRPRMAYADIAKRYTLITRPEEFRWEHRYPILYRPDPLKALDPWIYEQIFREVWRRKDMVLYNDEILFLGTRPTPHLLAMQTQGRSKGICVINGSQRPKGIPKVCITEANTIYAFYLSDPDDVRAIRQEMPEYDPHALDVSKFEFWFKQRGKPARKVRYERG